MPPQVYRHHPMPISQQRPHKLPIHQIPPGPMQKQQGRPVPAVVPHSDLHTVRRDNPNVLNLMRSSHAPTLGR